jgi:nucleoid DNA-binding protein
MADKAFYAKLKENFEAAGLTVSQSSTKIIYGMCLDATFKTAIDAGDMRLPAGMGSLKVRQLQATTKLNPRTQESVAVPQRKVIRYVMGKTVKSDLNV